MKEKIILTAREKFLKLGFKSVTMDDIAEHMAISKKTIYKFFPQKEQLINDCIEYSRNETSNYRTELRNKNLNAVEEIFEIRRHIKSIIQTAESSPIFQLRKHYPAIYEQLMNRERNDGNEFLRSNIVRGIEQGLYRADVDIDRVAYFYFTLFFDLCSNDDMAEEERNHWAALEYHIRAIATPKGIQELEKQLNIPN